MTGTPSADDGDEVVALVRAARTLRNGKRKLGLLERAVELGDREGSVTRSYFLRILLLKAAVRAGDHAKAFVAFSWCVARHDEVQDDEATEELVWSFKDILMNVPYLPQVPREEIFALEDEMERWFRRYGFSLRAVHAARMTCRIEMGLTDEIDEHHALWKAAPRDEMCWGVSAEADQELSYLFATGRDVDGLALAERLRDGGIPQDDEAAMQHMRARVIRPLLRQGRQAEAREYALAGLHSPRGATHAGAQHVAEYVLPLINPGEYSRALKPLTDALARGTDDCDKCRLYDIFALVLRRVAEARPHPLALNLPPDLPLHRADGKYAVLPLADWFEEQAGEIAARFDERNGTLLYADFLAETRRLLEA